MNTFYWVLGIIIAAGLAYGAYKYFKTSNNKPTSTSKGGGGSSGSGSDRSPRRPPEQT